MTLKSLDELSEGVTILEADRQKLIDSLTAKNLDIDELGNINSSYNSQIDSVKQRLSQLTIDKRRLEDIVDEQKNKIDSFNDFSFDFAEFKPVKMRRRKDNTYPVNFSSIELNFKIKQNYISNKNSESLIIMISIPNSKVGLQTKTITKSINYGQDYTITLEEEDNDNSGQKISFGAGLYLIQIIRNNGAIQNPILERTFHARKAYTK